MSVWYGQFQSYIFMVIFKPPNGIDVRNIIGLTVIINTLDICYRSYDLLVLKSTITFRWLISKSVANAELDQSIKLLWVKTTAWPVREPQQQC